MPEKDPNPELLEPREVADRLKMPAGTSTRSIAFAVLRLGVPRIWVARREWRVSRSTLEQAILRELEGSASAPSASAS